MENNVTDKTGIRKITKWIIGVVTVCILIYLAIRRRDILVFQDHFSASVGDHHGTDSECAHASH